MEDWMASSGGRGQEEADVHWRQRSVGRHEEHGRWALAMKLTIGGGVQQERDTRRK